MRRLLFCARIVGFLALGATANLTSHAQTFTVVADFDATNGNQPMGSLMQAADGSIYGTTNQGGSRACAGGCGTIFRIAPGGSLTTFHSFNGTDGAYPGGGLTQTSTGYLYGTTEAGGSSGAGTV